ncbi:hypothetical protein DFS33DRAFT_1429709 [Desarmillaria ectypa]|nr:hypothetical protein DFS33DRAFT_1429709 [Desarmillaria ectypa]
MQLADPGHQLNKLDAEDNELQVQQQTTGVSTKLLVRRFHTGSVTGIKLTSRSSPGQWMRVMANYLITSPSLKAELYAHFTATWVYQETWKRNYRGAMIVMVDVKGARAARSVAVHPGTVKNRSLLARAAMLVNPGLLIETTPRREQQCCSSSVGGGISTYARIFCLYACDMLMVAVRGCNMVVKEKGKHVGTMRFDPESVRVRSLDSVIASPIVTYWNPNLLTTSEISPRSKWSIGASRKVLFHRFLVNFKALSGGPFLHRSRKWIQTIGSASYVRPTRGAAGHALELPGSAPFDDELCFLLLDNTA